MTDKLNNRVRYNFFTIFIKNYLLILIFIGKGSGSLIGGYLMKAFGTRPTYQIFAVITLVTGIIYLIFNITYLKKQSQFEGNDIVKKKKIDAQNNFDKHANDIRLDEKPQERIKENKKMENNGLDNEGFLNEIQDNKLSNKANEHNL